MEPSSSAYFVVLSVSSVLLELLVSVSDVLSAVSVVCRRPSSARVLSVPKENMIGFDAIVFCMEYICEFVHKGFCDTFCKAISSSGSLTKMQEVGSNKRFGHIWNAQKTKLRKRLLQNASLGKRAELFLLFHCSKHSFADL